MSWFPRWGFGGGGRGRSGDGGASQFNHQQSQAMPAPPVQATIDPRQIHNTPFAPSQHQHFPQNYSGHGIQPAMSQASHVPFSSQNGGQYPALYQQIGMNLHQPELMHPQPPYTLAQQHKTYPSTPHQPSMPQTQPSSASSPYRQLQNLQDVRHQTHDQNLTDTGPKQTRKPTSSAETNGASARPSVPKFDPKLLLRDKGAGAQSVKNGDDAIAAEFDRAEPGSSAKHAETGLGMGAFLQRQHGLTNRDSTGPQRKRKSEGQEEEEGPDRKKSKAVIDGKISSGPLGQHMKEQREKYAAERGPSDAIDLTADDDGGDDEVVVTAENKVQRKALDNEVFCLGALTGQVNMSRLPMVSQKQLSHFGKEVWPTIKLELKREYGAMHKKVEVLDKQKNSCGMLESRLGRAISNLLDGRAAGRNNVEAMAYLTSRKREARQMPGMSISTVLNIVIVLNSPRGNAEPIGRLLSQQQLFLKHPSNAGVPCLKPYFNPQVPKSYAPVGAATLRQPQTSRPTTYSIRTTEEVQRQCMSMIDNLSKHEDMPRMEPKSGIIKTDLLDHQKQALHFLTDHEGEDNAFSLWKPGVDQKGNSKWEHVITGEELRRKPDPIRGGILADMMGLGKTLSILSLIAETKETAKSFFKRAQESSVDSDKINAVGTLIICPKSVLSNWEEQLETHVKADKLRCYTYHGSNRTSEVEELAKFNIVLTTYNTAAAEFAIKGKPLAAIRWFRIVLDEAHTIRTQNTKVFKAAIDLSANRRWAVTGTPVQNKLEDLQSLIRFLRIKPFDEPHIWAQYLGSPLKNGNPQAHDHLNLLVNSITLRRGKDKIDLPNKLEEKAILEFSHKDRKLYEKMSGNANTRLKRLTGGFQSKLKGKAYAHVLKTIGMLRQFCAHGLEMLSDEDRQEVLHGENAENGIAIDLGDDLDLDNFDNFLTDRAAFDYLQSQIDTDGNACVICAKKIGAGKADEDRDDDQGLESSSDDEEDRVLGYLTPCYHLLCPDCKPLYEQDSFKSLTADRRSTCPQCADYINYGFYTYQSAKFEEFVDAKANKSKTRRERRVWNEESYTEPSPKVQALLQELEKSEQETAALPEGEPPIRSVVFSGWTTYLDLIEVALDKHEIGFVRLDGSMSVRQRSAVLHKFANDPDITVILVSIKAGGQGLNFTAANKVYMMEPQYNPGVEHQAIDRVHRLGQKRDVVIKHFIMHKSVEEQIVNLQQRKIRMASSTLERGKKKSRVESEEERMKELRELFGKG